MSTPATPAVPAAPAAEPAAPPAPETPPAPAAAAPAEPAAPSDPPAGDDGIWNDPIKAKAEIERLRKENGKDRTTAKLNAAAEAEAATLKKIGEALGIIKPEASEPVDPAQLTKQVEDERAEARKAKVALSIYQNATTAGADPVAILDSASFLAKTAALDPSDTAALVVAMQEAVTANPRLGASPGSRLPAPNPAQGSSGSGAATLTPQQEAAQAEKAGNYAQAGAIKAQQLLTLRDSATN